jgi:hypothetical protein
MARKSTKVVRLPPPQGVSAAVVPAYQAHQRFGEWYRAEGRKADERASSGRSDELFYIHLKVQQFEQRLTTSVRSFGRMPWATLDRIRADVALVVKTIDERMAAYDVRVGNKGQVFRLPANGGA